MPRIPSGKTGSVRDVRIPADSADFETTQSKSALPPIEFTVSQDTTAGVNSFAVQDRQAVAGRSPTASYRVYFLPKEFSPTLPSTATIRQAGHRVANLVAEISAPGRGDTLNAMDITFGQRSGYYYCVAVNNRGIEAQPEQVVATP